MSNSPPTRASVCLLTPQGRGAIAALRVWGPDALPLVDQVFRPRFGPGLARTPPGRLRVGHLGTGTGDEVVALVVGEQAKPEVEVQCHGGPAAVELVVEAILAAGARRSTFAAWLADQSHSSLAAQAELDLTQAPTLRVAEILLDQARGAFDLELRALAEEVGRAPDLAKVRLAELRRWSAIGPRLLEGWRVALAGRPNVGKSRLLNALAGYERAIVSATPGTTRDALTLRSALDGWPVELIDTAGLRPTADPIELAGLAIAQARQGSADLVLLVLDRSEPLTEVDRCLLASLPFSEALVLANKSDLPAAWEVETERPGSLTLSISAERGDGLDHLSEAITRRIVPEQPAEGAGIPFRAAHAQQLEQVDQLLQAGRAAEARRRIEKLLGNCE